jgi:hypothetical protein
VEIFGNLPVWAVVLLGLLVAFTLIMLNVGWLLAAKGMLTAQRRRGGPSDDAAPAERTEATGGLPRRG